MPVSSPLQFDILILAAGEASRMGQAKQLLPIEGRPMLLRLIEIAQKTKPQRITVVLGSYAEQIQEVIQATGVSIVINSAWEAGMGSSIRAGIQYVSSQATSKPVLILLADQPLIHEKHIEKLYQEWKKGSKKIVASQYTNTFGVPAIFGTNTFKDLRQLREKQGAKKIIQSYQKKGEVQFISFPEGSIDLDTPEDYQRFLDTQ